MSGVFRNIYPHTPSPPSECVLPPHQRGGGTNSPGGGGWGVNILEDARHWICLLQYNLSPTGSHPLPTSVADPECLYRISDPNFYISDHGFWVKKVQKPVSESHQRI
jgi:hypothetical protein